MLLIEADILHIPLRPGLAIAVSGLPPDLTREEAQRIKKVLGALAARQPKEDQP
jgi:hypothetical protein